MELPDKLDSAEIQERWIAGWKASGIYAWDPERPRSETFVVDTPPPTVSGSLHVGHMFSYSHQDFIVRYQRMRGKNIFFPIGWDDNGLPTERRVQNLYNVKCEPHVHYDPNLKLERGRKGDALPISRRNFIELCGVVTKEDEEAFRRLWTRLGLSYEWGQEYATIDEHCRRISQLSFLELLDKGEVYHAERPVMWDVDFQTAIAQAEIEDRERPGAYCYLNFGIEGSDEKIVIATTRPELLAACVAVFVHPLDGRYKDIVGKTAITPLFNVPVRIIADAKADPEKGSGAVMCCTFGDQTDVEWWREHQLPLRQIVGRDGNLRPVKFQSFSFPGSDDKIADTLGTSPIPTYEYPTLIESLDEDRANEVYGQIQGKYVNQACKIVVEVAANTDGVIAAPPKEITHAVRFYEKGNRPLELVSTPQWYGRILDKKEALQEQGRKIQWHPDYMGKRYADWVDGLNQDWCMSRQRYFGVPIPLWYEIDQSGQPDFEKRIVPKPETLPIDPLDDVPPGYTNDQRDKPGGFTGDPDVFDTWATSSLTPQISSHWPVDMKRHKKLFPADIRPQSHEIIRTWAFYTITKAYMHEREIPWRHVVISGWILDPDRKKMSKSQGNVVTPEPLIDEFGSDSVRYWAARARLGVDTAYDEQVFRVGKRLCTKIFNASKFVIGRFANIDPLELRPMHVTEEMDRAAIAELRPLITKATEAFERFDYAQALSLTEEFFWGTFCDNFLEIAKPRTYDEVLTDGRRSACSALRIMHRMLIRLLAPFVPYITEEVWNWVYAKDGDMRESVHVSPWPTLAEIEDVPEPQHEDLYALSLQVIDAVRKAKAEKNLSIKAPVKNVTVAAPAGVCAALSHATIDVTRMLEIRELDVEEGEELSIRVEL
ncbi:MAG: valine--tRNA ligase [Candidatus Hydrogenedentota bacterium]